MDGFPPEFCVLRLLNKVEFIGKIEHLGRHLHPLESREELESLSDRDSEVVLPVDDKTRSLKILDKVAG